MDYSLTSMQIAALIITGIAYALLGSVKVQLSQRLQMSEAGIGGLMSAFGFTLIPMALVAGMLCDVIGRQFILSTGFVLIAISLIVLAQAGNYTLALFAVLIFGTGWAAAVNALNVLSPPAFLPLEDIPARNHYAMNLGDFIFGMGAFLAPIWFTISIRAFRLAPTFIIFAALACIPPLLGLNVNWEAEILKVESPGTIPEKFSQISEGMFILLQNPVVILCSIAMFFHFPMEFSVATWGTTLMVDKGMSESKSATLLSVFWLTFLGSRLITAIFLPDGFANLLVIVMAELAVVGLIGIVFSRNANVTAALVIALGAFAGPIFPTLIAILVGAVEPALQGRAVGIFFCIGGIGCTTIPLIVGATAKKTTIQRGFWYVVACACLLTLLCIALDLYLNDSLPLL